MGCSLPKTARDKLSRRAEAGQQLQVSSSYLELSSFHSKFQLADSIGGSNVFAALNKKDQSACAVKIIPFSDDRLPGECRSRRREQFQSEVEILCLARGHPNCVHLRAWFKDFHYGYLVIELCDDSLQAAFQREPEFNEITLVQYFREMLAALRHVHRQRIVHRNVMHSNFLVGAVHGQSSGRGLKLCNFGDASLVVSFDGLLSGATARGSPKHMAPEMLTSEPMYGTGVDVWSLGVIVYTLFFGHFPYAPRGGNGTSNSIKFTIANGTPRPTFSSNGSRAAAIVSQGALAFVKALLTRDPLTRPSATEAFHFDYLLARDTDATGEVCSQATSLKPMLQSAIKLGAFGDKRVMEQNRATREHLSRLQQAASENVFNFSQGLGMSNTLSDASTKSSETEDHLKESQRMHTSV